MPDRPNDWRQLALRWSPLALCAVVLIWHSLRFDFVTDDAYISFVYSRNLAEHGELTFNLGDRVEGYTNFLWTFLLGVLMLVGIPPEVAAPVLGTGFGIGTLVLSFRLTERLIGPAEEARVGAFGTGWAYLPPALLACSSGFACWSSGGLETQLFTFLVTFALDGYVAADLRPRLLGRVGVLLALAAMTRPEGLLVTAVIGVHRVAMNLARERRIVPNIDELICAASFLALWGPWFLWRWWYYGQWAPNTYYVKATWPAVNEFYPVVDPKKIAKYDSELRKAGVNYVWVWLEQTRLWWWGMPLVGAGLVAHRLRTPRFTFVTLAVPLVAIYLYYVVGVGGDFMGLHRFIMPLFVIAAVLVALGVERAAALIRDQQVRRIAGAVVVAAIVAGFARTQWKLTWASLHPKPGKFAEKGIDTPAFLIAYTENRAAIGKAMAPCFEPGDFSIVGGAGAQPYFGRMQAIDVFGLVSKRIAHEVAPGNPRPGHNKWGPDALLADYDPDFVFSCYFIHSAPAARPLPCLSHVWRERGFEQVTLQIPGLDGRREGKDDARAPGNVVADRYTFLVKKARAFECPGLTRAP